MAASRDQSALAPGTPQRIPLRAVYDFAVSPCSFDFAIFLVLAEQHRLRMGLSEMHVIFVPAPGDGFWDNEALDLDERLWRVRNLLVPLCSLWPSCGAVTVLASRADVRGSLRGSSRRNVFPVGYEPARPVPDAFLWALVAAEHACDVTLPVWSASAQARRLVDRWLAPRAGGRRVVVITLREAGYYSELNSNLAAWGDFARSLDTSKYFVVILRDTSTSLDTVPPALENMTLFPEASLNVEMRAALYEEMFIGLSVGTGPMTLQWLNPSCRFLIFRLLIPENFRSTPMPLRALGLEIGGQLSTGARFHRLVWEVDRVEVIRREFDTMVAEIDAGASPVADGREPPLRVARRLRETHRLAAARRIYQHLIAARRDRAAAHYGLSLLELETPRRFRLWRYWRAFRHYLAARVLRPGLRWEHIDEALEIGDARRRWHDRGGAAKIYRSVLAATPEQATALHRLGAIALARDDLEEAVPWLKRAVASDPHTAAYHYDLAEALRRGGRASEAAAHYRAAAAADPSHRAAHDAVAAIDPVDRAA